MEDVETAQRLLKQKQAENGILPGSILHQNPAGSSLVSFPTVLTNGDPRYGFRPVWCASCQQYPCRLGEEECMRQHAEKNARLQARMATALKDIGIGVRYQGLTFDDFIAPDAAAARVRAACERYAANFSERLKGCDNLLMLGNPGTGKNMLAGCICQSLTAQGFTVLHTTVMKLIRKIRGTWGKNREMTEQEAINLFTMPDLLVVDEVGVQYGTDAEKTNLFEVLNERYEDLRPTIIISNLSITEITGYLGPRIMDRFHDGKSTVLEFTWESYRRRQR